MGIAVDEGKIGGRVGRVEGTNFEIDGAGVIINTSSPKQRIEISIFIRNGKGMTPPIPPKEVLLPIAST